MSCYNTEFAIRVIKCVASALEWESVVSFCSKVFDLVLCEIGSDVFWRVFNILLLLLDRVLLDIGSGSSTVLIIMFLIFDTLWTVSLSTPLEVVAGLFTRSLLEVGNQYFSGFDLFSMRGVCDVLF